jgi:hypothetical protein
MRYIKSRIFFFSLAQNRGIKSKIMYNSTNLHSMIAAQAELFLVESCNTDEAPQTFFPVMF